MRKVPVLASLAAAFALFAAPVGAETLFGTDPADVQLAPGATANDSFDLDDFFDSTNGAISYTATGASVDANGVADVMGLSNPGSAQANFTASDGGAATVTKSSSVWVSNFQLGNVPAVDNNNRIAGQAGGNWFQNLVAAGETLSSNLPITGIPAGGSGGTGGATGGPVTGSASLIAAVASVGINTNDVTGLRSRTINGAIATGAGSANAANNLQATLNSDGSYQIVAHSNFSGNWIVSLGARSGASADAFHVLVNKANVISLANADVTTIPAGTLQAGQYAAGTFTVGPGQGTLAVANAPVAVNGKATINVYYEASSVAGVNIAAVGFDGALDGTAVSFTNPGGPHLQGGNVRKCISVSMTVKSNSVIPAVQVANQGSAAATVRIVRFVVADAGPLTDYTVNLNSKATLGADGGVSALAGWTGNVLGEAGTAGPTLSSANKFSGVGASSSLGLNGSGGIANAYTTATVGAGTVTAEAYVQRVGAATAGSAFALVFTDGVASINAFKSGGTIADSGWDKVTVSSTLSTGTTGFFVAQAANGLNVNVDDLSLRVVSDKDNHFDAALLGGL